MAAKYWRAGAFLIAVSSLAAGATPAPQPPPAADAVSPATVALVESWPDGLTNYELTTTSGTSRPAPRPR